MQAADYPGVMNSIQDLMKLGGSLPSLGAFPSFFGARSLADPTSMAAFSAASQPPTPPSLLHFYPIRPKMRTAIAAKSAHFSSAEAQVRPWCFSVR